MKNDNKHPADLFIDRYMAGASDKEREEARENMVRFVAVLVRINERLRRERAHSDSPEFDSCDRFEIGDAPKI
jgi:hypothetical protein